MRDAFRRASRFTAVLLTLGLLLTARPAHAVKVPLGEDAFINVGALLQPQMQIARDAAPVGDVGTDFYLRRVRLILSGNVTKKLSFFIETDQVNLGRDGNWNVPFYVQDAVLSYEFAHKVWLDAGMILVPFSHHGMQGAATLNTLDYHASLLRYLPTVGKVWRDAGVQLRAFAGPVHVRVGVFNGAEGTKATATAPTVNPDDLPRVVGTVRYNFLGTEDAMFLSGIYFTDKPLLSVGLSADYQPSAVAGVGRARDASAFAADVFLDLPMSPDSELIAQADVYNWRQSSANPDSGTGFFAEVGYRFGTVEPVLSGEYFNGRGSDRDTHPDLLAIRPGLNLWFQKYTWNFKTELALSRTGDISNARTGITGTAQLQLFY